MADAADYFAELRAAVDELAKGYPGQPRTEHLKGKVLEESLRCVMGLLAEYVEAARENAKAAKENAEEGKRALLREEKRSCVMIVISVVIMFSTFVYTVATALYFWKHW